MHGTLPLLDHLLQLVHTILNRAGGDWVSLLLHVFCHRFTVDGDIVSLENTEEQRTIRRRFICMVSTEQGLKAFDSMYHPS